jgi:hypothetical protein
MKKIISILSLLILFAACKKETVKSIPLNEEVAKIKATLKDSLTEQEMNAIDWSKAKAFKKGIDDKGWCFTIASEAQNDLIYAILENSETKFIRHQFSKSDDPSTFAGFSIRSDLSQRNKIVNWYSNNALSKSVQISNGVQNVLFENSSSNGRLGVYSIPLYYLNGTYWLQFIPGQTGNIIDAVSNMTLSNDPNSAGGTGGVGEMIEIEVEDGESKESRDIEKIFKCFDQIPNGPGTTYKVKLCADVPVNSAPSAAVNTTLSPGHTFLVMTKSNGGQSVSQPFGFYPLGGFSSLGLNPVSNKIVLDANHEINASIEIECTYSEFENIRLFGKLWADTKQYDLDDYNCSNFAIDLFNKARFSTEQIEVDPKVVYFPFTNNPIVILKSPQTLFEKLKSMKDTNHPDASKIIIDQTHSTKAPAGSGECQ